MPVPVPNSRKRPDGFDAASARKRAPVRGSEAMFEVQCLGAFEDRAASAAGCVDVAEIVHAATSLSGPATTRATTSYSCASVISALIEAAGFERFQIRRSR